MVLSALLALSAAIVASLPPSPIAAPVRPNAGPSDPLAVVQAYERAANSHDFRAVDAVLGLRPVVALGGDTELVGREAVQALHEWDRAMGTEIHYSDCRADGQVVTCRATERNDLLRLAGLASVDYETAQLTIEQGLVVRMSAELTAASATRVNAFMGPFLGWASAHHAEALGEVVREDGSIAFGYQTGLAFKRLARLFSLTRPGLSRVL